MPSHQPEPGPQALGCPHPALGWRWGLTPPLLTARGTPPGWRSLRWVWLCPLPRGMYRLLLGASGQRAADLLQQLQAWPWSIRGLLGTGVALEQTQRMRGGTVATVHSSALCLCVLCLCVRARLCLGVWVALPVLELLSVSQPRWQCLYAWRHVHRTLHHACVPLVSHSL